MPWFETITDLEAGAERLRTRRYGRIEVDGDGGCAVQLRPFPTQVSWFTSRFVGRTYHAWFRGDRCRLYYNQPRTAPQFLALTFVVSARDTSLATFRRAVTLLDEIARLKGSDALLCEATNLRISDRLLHRWGWVPQRIAGGGRHYIKRLYPGRPELARRIELASQRALDLPPGTGSFMIPAQTEG